MQIQQVYTVRSQFLETGLHTGRHLVGHIVTRRLWILDLGSQRQAAVLPADLAREGLLFPTDIDTCSVDFAVAT